MTGLVADGSACIYGPDGTLSTGTVFNKDGVVTKSKASCK